MVLFVGNALDGWLFMIPPPFPSLPFNKLTLATQLILRSSIYIWALLPCLVVPYSVKCYATLLSSSFLFFSFLFSSFLFFSLLFLLSFPFLSFPFLSLALFALSSLPLLPLSPPSPPPRSPRLSHTFPDLIVRIRQEGRGGEGIKKGFTEQGIDMDRD